MAAQTPTGGGKDKGGKPGTTLSFGENLSPEEKKRLEAERTAAETKRRTETKRATDDKTAAEGKEEGVELVASLDNVDKAEAKVGSEIIFETKRDKPTARKEGVATSVPLPEDETPPGAKRPGPGTSVEGDPSANPAISLPSGGPTAKPAISVPGGRGDPKNVIEITGRGNGEPSLVAEAKVAADANKADGPKQEIRTEKGKQDKQENKWKAWTSWETGWTEIFRQIVGFALGKTFEIAGATLDTGQSFVVYVAEKLGIKDKKENIPDATPPTPKTEPAMPKTEPKAESKTDSKAESKAESKADAVDPNLVKGTQGAIDGYKDRSTVGPKGTGDGHSVVPKFTDESERAAEQARNEAKAAREAASAPKVAGPESTEPVKPNDDASRPNTPR